jgi:hypothetical protein
MPHHQLDLLGLLDADRVYQDSTTIDSIILDSKIFIQDPIKSSVGLMGLLLVLLLIVDIVISLWNAYASGYNIGMIRKSKAKAGALTRAAAYSGLGLGFAGIAYVLIMAISYIAYALGYVGAGVVSYAASLNFLVFGFLIIGFGLMVTIQSIAIAVKKRSLFSIVIALWNVFAEVWDIASYVQGFKEATGVIRGNRNSRNGAIEITLISVLLAFFITHAAYRHGLNKAMDSA